MIMMWDMSDTLLVKIGGSLKGASGLLDEIAAYPGKLVLVHGGGPNIGEWLTRLGFSTEFKNGLRVTPPEQMEVVEMVLSTLGKQLAHGLTKRGRPAVALSGRDNSMLSGRLVSAELGRVGEVTNVDTRLINILLEGGITPLIAPIGLDETGPLNVNADICAGAIAGALDLPAVFLTDVIGVMKDFRDPSTRYPSLSSADIRLLIEQEVISGGMIPKVESALNAVEQKAPWAAIAKGEEGVLQAVLDGTRGTKILL